MRLMTAMAAAGAAVLLGGVACHRAPAARLAPGADRRAAAPPNVIVILADDLGYGDLSAYGQTRWQTPVIDRMAREGARLTSFYVPMPYCAPSRATLLTGRYSFRHSLFGNPAPDGRPGFGEDTMRLAPAERTLAEVLEGAGYATALVGKWHLGHHARFRPQRQGFDEYFGIPYSNVCVRLGRGDGGVGVSYVRAHDPFHPVA
jgi:uncharacterized sulfatase